MSSDFPLDSTRIRALFPAFSEPTLRGQAFFENAGGSYTSRHVLERLNQYYRTTKVQPYGAYKASIEAGAAMDLGYARMGEALGLSADWIQIGPSTSANSYFLAQAFSKTLKSGDAIIVTDQDHEANSGVWRRFSALGIEVRQWSIDPQSGHLDPNALDNLLDDKVRLVAFPHCSNIVGEINPAKDICARIHKSDALAIVDGVSYAPHGLPDVKDMGADIYFFSAYKTYGPHQGVMAIRPELAASLPNQGHHFNDHKPRYRLNPAGPDHAQIAALAGVADYVEALSEIADPAINGDTPFRRAHNATRAQEKRLIAPLLDWINAKNSVRLIGPETPEKHVPTLSLALDSPGLEIAKKLASHAIMAGGGHFYSQRTLQALGIDPEHGVLRLSFVHYTSPDEISSLIEALSKVLD